MKNLILILLILFIGCQRKHEINTLIKENHQFVDLEYKQLLSNIEIKYASNPEKYTSFLKILYPLRESNHIIEESILSEKKIGEQIIINNSSYSSKLIDLIDDENTRQFISQQINELFDQLSSKSKISQERSILLVTRMKSIQNFAIKEALSQHSVNDYTFNKLFPIVIENKKVLKKGETYTAEILMAGINTTTMPILKINEKEIPFNEKGRGVLKIETNNSGTFIWSGVVKMFNDNTGIVKHYPIQGEYKVK